jgi:hypothetical protein
LLAFRGSSSSPSTRLLVPITPIAAMQNLEGLLIVFA